MAHGVIFAARKRQGRLRPHDRHDWYRLRVDSLAWVNVRERSHWQPMRRFYSLRHCTQACLALLSLSRDLTLDASETEVINIEQLETYARRLIRESDSARQAMVTCGGHELPRIRGGFLWKFATWSRRSMISRYL